MPQDWFKCLWKKRRGCVHFLLQWQGQRSQKKSLSSDCAENLAESNKVLLHCTSTRSNGWRSWTSSQAPNATCQFPQEHLVQANQKSWLKNLLKIWKAKNTETWQKLHGPAIVAGERLQEKINKSVTCCFCQGSIELVENSQTLFHLDVPVPEQKLSVARN